jgi:hypothetical protein
MTGELVAAGMLPLVMSVAVIVCDPSVENHTALFPENVTVPFTIAASRGKKA